MSERGVASAILGQSPAVRCLRRRLVAAARVRATVLLSGETGTGKGLAARTLHALSADRDRPFVHVDCAALSPGLVESEIFGHERGAFTGASARYRGRLERAGTGTLFLDEIGELTPTVQAKWLRALQDREFERVGGDRTLRLDARLVTATHRDLRADVEAGRFRADLYFRLAVVRIRVPPLRERPGDAGLIARRALDAIARRLGCPAPAAEPSLFAALEAQPWPGNLRELFNALESLVVHHPGRSVGARELLEILEPVPRPEGHRPIPTAPPCVGVAASMRERAVSALDRSHGNVARAARDLGWARSTLRDRLVAWGLGSGRGQPGSMPDRTTR